MNPAANKADTVLVSGAVVKPLEFLAVGPHIHEKDGAIQTVALVFLGDHGLFDGIHAADRRAVGMIAFVHVPRTNTLKPCDFFGGLMIGNPGHMAHGGTGCG